MRLLVFGQSGQVARELARLAPDAMFLGREKLDLINPEYIASAIAERAPAAVINAAAYTAVDRAEQEEALALTINGTAPQRMAEACSVRDIPFVHISTDYVFDGSGDVPHKPNDAVSPLGAYGRTKLAGEQGVAAAGGVYAILRTSWVFSAHGGNFVKTMLRLAQSHRHLTVVGDQVGGPTPAAGIAATCLEIARQLAAEPMKSGIYHYGGAPNTSWAGFAREIFSQAGCSTTVAEIPSSDYPTPAARPLNSRLDCASLQEWFGIAQPSWKEALSMVLKELDT